MKLLPQLNVYSFAMNRSIRSFPHDGRNPKIETSLCNFSGHLCQREKLPNYDYCLRHILEDKGAPFKQCSFNIKSQKRCQKAAPKADKRDGYCAEHSRKTLMSRHKVISKKRNVDLTQRCLEDLSHYKKKKVSSDSFSSSIFPLKEEETTSSELTKQEKEDPFAILENVPSKQRMIADGEEIFADEDDDDIPVEQVWHGDKDSDAESIDSDMENPLKHAGGYSAEEVIRIMREKLIRLQKSYIDQFQRLQYLLREERRQYKHQLRKEKESLMSIHKQPKETSTEQIAYDRIKALNHYNKPQGKDAIFAANVKEKRLKVTEGAAYKSPLSQLHKCVYNITSNTKCGEISIPLSKYCMKHIMEDSSQVLFRPCGFITEADDGPCETPVVDTFEGNTCIYHTQLFPSYSQYNEEPVSLSQQSSIDESSAFPLVSTEISEDGLKLPVDLDNSEKLENTSAPE